jgi:hypothetical protein
MKDLDAVPLNESAFDNELPDSFVVLRFYDADSFVLRGNEWASEELDTQLLSKLGNIRSCRLEHFPHL